TCPPSQPATTCPPPEHAPARAVTTSDASPTGPHRAPHERTHQHRRGGEPGPTHDPLDPPPAPPSEAPPLPLAIWARPEPAVEASEPRRAPVSATPGASTRRATDVPAPSRQIPPVPPPPRGMSGADRGDTGEPAPYARCPATRLVLHLRGDH